METAEIQNSEAPEFKVFGEHLVALVLSGRSVLAASVLNTVRAYRFGLPLEISGKGNPGYEALVYAAKSRGIKFVEVQTEFKDLMSSYQWTTDTNSSSLRAHAPAPRFRELDAYVSVPFYLEYHNWRFREKDSTFRTPVVSNLYVLNLLYSHFGLAYRTAFSDRLLSTNILKDLLQAEQTQIMTTFCTGSHPFGRTESIYTKVQELSECARRWIGFCADKDWEAIAEAHKMENHPLNKFRNHRMSVPHIGGYGAFAYPGFVQTQSWRLEEVFWHLRNMFLLNIHFRVNETIQSKQILEFLKLRLKNSADQVIQETLGFSDEESFLKWQSDNYVNQIPVIFKSPLAKWREACDYFGLVQDAELLEARSEKELGGFLKAIPETAIEHFAAEENRSVEAEIGFVRASADYRTVLIGSGTQITLTEKQAQVIGLLHEALLNDTPELGQSYLINEVYGETANSSLKKLFGDDVTWQALVEQGSRRGLLKLRMVKPLA